ncbi:3-deoxy-manno-octulosonate cytidylyltransferase [Pyramidobacter piscolens]|uniref:3-deoxy-manno-octulosonate cytidylyltransferase n=1 Tax=Pyramidobacter piscolens TaxID=638849 RepID=UPI001FCA8E90|nr:3-deoxy-manno-octulosonate cytidylyltransferase [Pyramidobacter piscolens]BDF78830.1 3-deoxy-manno-octulosonate cytidylyltransferase [Pyramidobacter piscolens]
MKTIGIIPARWASSRLPGKPLADLCGKPVIQHVYERCLKARSLAQVIVATDDERIMSAVAAFGGRAVMTSSHHPNGTSRVAEVAARVECDYVVNIQGDEPLIDPRVIDQLAGVLLHADAPMATLSAPFSSAEEAADPNNVKVVVDRKGRALYFSRSVIPFARCGTPVVYKHIGIYGYRKDFLPVYSRLAETPLAEAESLEQLRALEHGYDIAVAVSAYPDRGVGINTPHDLELARKLMSEKS